MSCFFSHLCFLSWSGHLTFWGTKSIISAAVMGKTEAASTTGLVNDFSGSVSFGKLITGDIMTKLCTHTFILFNKLIIIHSFENQEI